MADVALIFANPVLFGVFALAFGLLIGSFLNVVIYRLPIMMERDWREQCRELLAGDSRADTPAAAEPDPPFNLLEPRSACPECKTTIPAWHNIPLLSYALLRGRCAQCRTRISARYPTVELLSGLIAIAVTWRFGPGWEAIAAAAVSWSLIALSGIDIDRQLLPDSITLPLLWAGLCASLLHKTVPGEMLFINPRSSLIGAALGYLSLWSVYQLFKLVTGKEGMGYGDFKLLAALGAWLGWQMLPLIIILSALVGAVAGIAMILLLGRERQLPIPFGPYLAAAGWVAMMAGDDLVGWYLRLTGQA